MEGGGNKAADSHCRQAFHTLLEKAGFKERLPRVIPCGGRDQAFDDFTTALNGHSSHYPILLVDSEDPVAEANQLPDNPSGAWQHLASRHTDSLHRPDGALDDQAQLMVTAMETWLVADRSTLASYFHGMKAGTLPPDVDLESRDRKDVLEKLENATDGRYRKGSVSFEVLGKVDPAVLQGKLPHFQRFIDTLNAHT